MSLSQIRYFVAVADEQHVGRAAASLRVAQPALSRQIKNLEDELGAPLFVRTPRGMRLAPPGAAFLPHARAILARLDDAAAAARAPPAPPPPHPPRPGGARDPPPAPRPVSY